VRGLAFALLTLAAFAIAVPFLDRAGLALLGLACGVASLPPAPRRIRRPAIPFAPPLAVELDDEPEESRPEVVSRISDYLASSGRPT
jgi:hypothetical protein